MISQPQTFDTKAIRKIVLDMAYVDSTVHIGYAFTIIEHLAFFWSLS
jgi:transketolase